MNAAAAPMRATSRWKIACLCAISGGVPRRSFTVALIVGTILMVINQADVLISGNLTALVAAKIGLTYLVPFSVSMYSALAANRLQSPVARGEPVRTRKR